MFYDPDEDFGDELASTVLWLPLGWEAGGVSAGWDGARKVVGAEQGEGKGSLRSQHT